MTESDGVLRVSESDREAPSVCVTVSLGRVIDSESDREPTKTRTHASEGAARVSAIDR